ncbi:MAG: hypothetical protein Q7J28_06750 [Caulobacter sp.]|nr:hypothetical protein [Caulobacter sp.]
MRTAALMGFIVAATAACTASAAADFKAQARCIAAYEVAAGLLEADSTSAATKKRIAKLDAARERMSLALATRTDLTAADSRASQQERRAEEARLDALPPAQVQAAADACDSLLGQ